MQSVLEDGKKRMAGAIAALDKEFGKLRTGRATTSLVDNIIVDYYGTPTPVSQLSSVSVPDPKTLTIQPWDKGAFGAVEKAIMASDLGLTPNNDGSVIRITIPALTEERRKELVKVGKKYTEDCKIAIRNVRRDLNDMLKLMEKEKEISEDDRKKGEADVQKLTNDFVKESDVALAAKEQEILAI